VPVWYGVQLGEQLQIIPLGDTTSLALMLTPLVAATPVTLAPSLEVQLGPLTLA